MPHTLAQTFSRLSGRQPDPRTDADLLASFQNHADADAFQVLVRRHGPLVLGACRRILGLTPDAEDAFQATFLVLIRRAGDIRWRESIGPWLYGVAVRVAKKARHLRQRRGRIEPQVLAMTSEPGHLPSEPDDLAAVLDEELAQLPEKYRRPLILCELQGLTRKAAAEALKLSEGTLSSRLARGRQMLRQRLIRRGVTATALALAVVPEALVAATMQGAAGVVPAAVTALTEGVVKAMFVTTKLKLAAVLVAVGLGLTGVGVWSAGGPGRTATAEEPKPVPRPAPAPAGVVHGAVTSLTPPTDAPAGVAPGVVVPNPVAVPPVMPALTNTVATIFGDEKLTKEQFTEYLFQRYGQKDVEKFVNLAILQSAFGKKGWAIKAEDLNAATQSDLKAMNMKWAEFREAVILRLGRTEEEWIRDVLEPRLMLAQLTRSEIMGVTEAELKSYFEEQHGEYRNCHRVAVRNEEKAKAFHAKVKAAPESFLDETAKLVGLEKKQVRVTCRMPKTLLSPHGLPEIKVHAAAAVLKAGEVSDLIDGENGYWVILQCVEVVSGDEVKRFAEEKPLLFKELMDKKINAMIPTVFNDLKKRANPQYHLFPRPASPVTANGEVIAYDTIPVQPKPVTVPPKK